MIPDDDEHETLAEALDKAVQATNGGNNSAVAPVNPTPQDVFQQLAHDMAAATNECAEHTAKQIEEQAERLVSEAQSFLQRSKIISEEIRQRARARADEQAHFIGTKLRESSLALDAIAAKFEIKLAQLERPDDHPVR